MRFFLLSLCLFFVTSCNRSKDLYVLKIKDTKSVEENILTVERLMKKIPKAPHYENNYQVYYVKDDNSISLIYSNISYQDKDSIVKSRYDPNPQRIDTLSSIKGLTSEEFLELKNSIYSLKKENINNSHYMYNEFSISDINNTIIKEYKCPFFAYQYDFKDWMSDNPEMIGYIVVLNTEQLKSECFTEFYEIKDQKGNVYLVVRK